MHQISIVTPPLINLVIVTESSPILRTPLYSISQESQAKFINFAGWQMPLQYSGLKKEHQAVRESAGIFDISHMGKFCLQGANLREKLSLLVPSDLTNLMVDHAQYTVLINEQGGIIDDVIFYYQGIESDDEEKGILIVNASTKAKDWQWLETHLVAKNIALQDYTHDLALIALQGPEAVNYLNDLIKEDLQQLTSFAHLTTQIEGENLFIARTGYTGEDGFEMMTTPQLAQKLWVELLEMGVIPCGLGARDTLRLEASMCLYGADINEQTTPLEAGLGWLVNFNHDFIAKDILLAQKQQGISKKLVALKMPGRYIARHGYQLFLDEQVVGQVTSGTLSPSLNMAIALGYVPYSNSKIGQKLTVEIRNKKHIIEVVKKPFYRASSLKRT